MSSSTVYLVTGAGRGLGLALVQKLAENPNNVIIAGLRNTKLDNDHPLAVLIAKSPETVISIKLTSADEGDNAAAAEVVKEKFGKVDVIIANAAISSGIQPITSVTPATLRAEIETNTFGPLVLFQAFASLLNVSKNAKFVSISSLLGQIEESLPYPYNSYGLSKAALNFVAKKIDQEVSTVTSFPIHPGVVETDMARTVAAESGQILKDFGAITPAESASGLLAVIESATKESHGGKFWNYDGSRLTY